MIILCADDFGLTDGVSRAIVQLCHARRLSATSALVTFDTWPSQAQLLQELRPTTAVGLHFNLTLGRPCIATKKAAHLDASGAFLPLSKLVLRALSRHLDEDQIRQECSAQICAFQIATGTLPDFIDGHQHVHALPVVRHGVLAAIADYNWPQKPLMRAPLPQPFRARLSMATALKARAVDWLARGYDRELSKAGLPSNDTFAGFSAFVPGRYASELEAALDSHGACDQGPNARPNCHLVMCHPGYVDDDLANSGDPVIEQRREEFDTLMAREDLPARIWRPRRSDDGTIDWFKAMGR